MAGVRISFWRFPIELPVAIAYILQAAVASRIFFNGIMRTAGFTIDRVGTPAPLQHGDLNCN